jgi:hypothetical protein
MLGAFLLCMSTVQVRSSDDSDDYEDDSEYTEQQEASCSHEHDPEIMLANFFNILVHGAQAVNPSKPTEEKLDALASVLMSIAAIAQLAFKRAGANISRKALETALLRAILENPKLLVLFEQKSPAICRQLNQLSFVSFADRAPHDMRG